MFKMVMFLQDLDTYSYRLFNINTNSTRATQRYPYTVTSVLKHMSVKEWRAYIYAGRGLWLRFGGSQGSRLYVAG